MPLSYNDLIPYLTAIFHSNQNNTLTIHTTSTHYIIITPRAAPATRDAEIQTDPVTIFSAITSTYIKRQVESLKSYYASPYFDEEPSDDESEIYEGDRFWDAAEN
jgi:hypothetical protein